MLNIALGRRVDQRGRFVQHQRVRVGQDQACQRQLLGLRRGKRRYEPFPPDAQGRLYLETGGLLLGLRDEWVVCFDAATGEEIPDYASMDQALQTEAAARRQAPLLPRAQRRLRSGVE